MYAIDDHLVEADLAAQFEVSRTPVREALRRLSSEGLVTFQPNRGARVAGWNETELAEIFELRALLESYGARLAAVRITDEQIDEIRQLAANMEELVVADPAATDFRQVALANNEFHHAVLKAAGNERLVAVLSSLVHVPLVQRTFAYYSPEALHRSLAHHRECVEALAARDPLWAESVMRAHILAARQVPSGAAATAADDGAGGQPCPLDRGAAAGHATATGTSVLAQAL